LLYDGIDSIRGAEVLVATLTVRSLDDALVRAHRIRAAEHGRSAEAEHREILRLALTGTAQPSPRAAAAARLAEFRHRTSGRGTTSAIELLRESRTDRVGDLSGTEDG
jgi:plasmid stability protein